MKQVLLSIAVIATMISCSNKPGAELKTEVAVVNPQPVTNDYTTDKRSNGEYQTTAAGKQASYKPERRPVKIIYRDAPVKKANTTPVYLPPVTPAPPANPGTTGNNSTPTTTPAPSDNNTSTSGNSTTTDQAGTATQPVVKKKGWNNATKGAVIGGVVGAAGGAILSKKKAQGAIIGGVIGAAGGYIFGHARDKKATSEFTY